jgi:predicted short-subunit dehydrogenase-like oxidoreductase (DUF2520 family)
VSRPSPCASLFLTSSVPAAILGSQMRERAIARTRVKESRPVPIATRHSTIVNRKRVGFIGAGRVGCTLAWHCNRLGYPIAGVTDLKPKQAWVVYGLMKQHYERLSSREVAASSDVLFLTVPDTHIAPVYESVRKWLMPGTIVAHCSGAFGTEVLAGAREQGLGTLALHPVQSFFSHSQAIRSLPGTSFAADGSVSGLRFGRHLVRQLHGGWVRVRGSDRAMYHAMCVFASNFVSALFGGAEEIGCKLGISRRRTGVMLAPLARTVLDNIAEQGAGPSLTGPVERGDAVTVAAHLRALERRSPGLAPMYRVMSERLVAMAAKKGLDMQAVDRIREALEHQ